MTAIERHWAMCCNAFCRRDVADALALWGPLDVGEIRHAAYRKDNAEVRAELRRLGDKVVRVKREGWPDKFELTEEYKAELIALHERLEREDEEREQYEPPEPPPTEARFDETKVHCPQCGVNPRIGAELCADCWQEESDRVAS